MADDDDGFAPPRMSDDKFDELFAGLQRWSEDERKKYCEGLDEHPLFLDHSPSQREVEDNSALSALANVEYDEYDTPITMATESKEKGNSAFQKGPDFYGHAIKHYNDCIDHASKAIGKGNKKSDRETATALTVAAYANLAAIYLARKKYITALDCCERALKLQADHSKALYRAAKCSLETGRATAAVKLCEKGIAATSKAPADSKEGKEHAAFADLLKQSQAVVKRQQQMRKEVEAEQTNLLTRLFLARKGAKDRGIIVGPPLYRRLATHIAGPNIKPYPTFEEDDGALVDDPYARSKPVKAGIDTGGLLNWPVLVLYPEHHTADFLQQCPEVASVRDLLATVLPASKPPHSNAPPPLRLPWDVRGEYWIDGVDVFYSLTPEALLSASSSSAGEPWADIEGDARKILEADLVSSFNAPKKGSSDSAVVVSSSSSDDPHDTSSFSSLYTSGTCTLIRVPHSAPLMLALVQKGNIVCDIPVLYVLPRGSAIWREYQARAGGSFKAVQLPKGLEEAMAAGAGAGAGAR